MLSNARLRPLADLPESCASAQASVWSPSLGISAIEGGGGLSAASLSKSAVRSAAGRCAVAPGAIRHDPCGCGSRASGQP